MNILLIEKGEESFLSSDRRYSHIKSVLRLSVGDRFKIGEINGRRGWAEILSLDDERMTFTSSFESIIDKSYPLDLIVAQVRPISMKRILRDSASIGIRRLILPISELGERSYSQSHLYKEEGYRNLILDGAMQAGKTNLTEVHFPKSLEEAIEMSEGERILLDKEGAISLSKADLSGKSVTLSIGPERGWTAREQEAFIKSGFKRMSLGERILRTETAVVFSSSLALSRMGLLK